MTKRLAIFVEGLTEQEFVIRLLNELAGKRQITLEIRRQHGGCLSLIEVRSQPSPNFYILIANCCNDDQVKSQIKDQYTALKAAGYSLIIGLRDVFPFHKNEIQNLETNLLVGLPNDNPPIHLHLAIMEIEAWFIQEISHFANIDSNLTPSILAANGFDPDTDIACDLPNPAETLDNIYKCVGKRYIKDRKRIQRTINALSYEELYVYVRDKAPSLNNFLTSLEHGLFS